MKTNAAALLKDLVESGYIKEYFTQQFPDLNPEPGRDSYSVLCPFHGDSRESMSLDVAKGLFICHVGCAQGSVFDFRMKKEDITLAEALRRFTEELSVYRRTNGDTKSSDEKPETKKAPEQPVTMADVQRWSRQLSEPQYAEILEGLRKRGLTKETNERFLLGAGIDAFSRGTITGKCLVIPVVHKGVLVTVKKILYKDGDRYFKTIGKSKVLYNKDVLSETTDSCLFVCEGELDCMRLAQERLPAVTSCGGALSWDERWRALFKGRDVVLVFDSDRTGRNGASKVLHSLAGVAKTLRNVDLFPGTTDKLKKDVSDFFLLGKSLRDFLEIVENTPYLEVGDAAPRDSLIVLIDKRVLDSDNRFRRNEDIAEIIFTWIGKNGGSFFRDQRNNVYLVINGQSVLVDFTDRQFESYLFSIARITSGDIKGRVIVKGIQALGLERGQLVSESAFLRTDYARHVLWVNPSLEWAELLRISPDGIAVLPNGTNDENMFLLAAGMMKPLTFVRLTKDQIKDGLVRIENLALAHLACAETDKWLVLMWAMGFLLKDFVKMRPLMRFEGISSGGKTTGMELLTELIYGEDQKAIATLAAQYSEGANNPILFLDNIERRNLGSGEVNFFLTSSTGISKRKRKQGSDVETVVETPRCLVLSTGIENLSGQELINRSLIVEFDRTKYGSDLTEGVFHQIVAERSFMMSAVFHLQVSVLDRMSAGDWDQLQEMLKKEFPHHSKERANPYLALMLLILDEWFAITGRSHDVQQIARRWIERQDRASRATGLESNPVLQYLDLLVSTMLQIHQHRNDVENPPVWNHPLPRPLIIDHDSERKERVPTKIVFQGFASEIHLTFMELMKGLHPGYLFRDGRQLAARINDSIDELSADGWDVRKVHRRKGRTVWRFEKQIDSSWEPQGVWDKVKGVDHGMIGNDQNDD